MEMKRKEENSFRSLQRELLKQPVLAIYDPTLHTEVHTDASVIGLAAVLSQRQKDERLHPVLYYSRQTSDMERKMHSYELETLAVVEGLKEFCIYLIGKHFTGTDSQDCKVVVVTTGVRL